VVTPEQRWLTDYLAGMPDRIRPNPGDQRFLAAAAQAFHNSWTGRQAAHAVASRSYATAHNPTLIAIVELERIGGRPPHQVADQTSPSGNSSGCIVCAPGQPCPHPVLEQRIPDQWTRERFQLLKELQRIPADQMSEDEGEQAMRILIHHQHGR
jgi:hypothetical protein